MPTVDVSTERRTIVALLTSHERRTRTLAALESFERQVPTGCETRAVLVDAGSTDGTPDVVKDRFPTTDVLRVGAGVFWNQGMRIALAHARRSDPDYYLWLNDDTVLDDDALDILLSTDGEVRGRSGLPGVVVGTTRDPISGEPTYGGVTRQDPRRPMRFRLVTPGSSPREVETMNGNCVLLPREVVEAVGNLEASYTHAMGDLDYGLRVRSAGMTVWVAPGTIGTCARNRAVRRSAHAEMAHLAGPKGLPPREWRVFVRRWGGGLWPFYFASPYVRRIMGLER
jgi:GT2 family glycosyltransferase